MSAIRVRFAPSPTGELHIGGARTALFNFLFARHHGGTFILRIDDTDIERSKDEYTEKLIQAMQWLGLKWDEGPYYQSARLIEYQKEAARLIDENKAYRCYCSIETLAKGREEAKREGRPYLYPGTCSSISPVAENNCLAKGIQPVIRLRTPADGDTVVKDLVKGDVHFDNSGFDDFIILKSNGQPTYNFASVVDDLQMNITHIIRAEEHLTNTPRQIHCALAIGSTLPVFAHVPMILAPDRSKLSKRHGATSVEEFRTLGFLSGTLINYMALLGWSPSSGGERDDIFTLPEMIELFKIEKVNKTAAIYDLEKLTWMNGHYIRSTDVIALADAAKPFYLKRGLIYTDESEHDLLYLKQVIACVRERAKTLIELADISSYFYEEEFNYDHQGIENTFKKPENKAILIRIGRLLENVEVFDRQSTEELFKKHSEDYKISLGKIIQPVRLALTGLTGGPGLFEIMELLGREKTIKRISRAVAYINAEL